MRAHVCVCSVCVCARACDLMKMSRSGTCSMWPTCRCMRTQPVIWTSPHIRKMNSIRYDLCMRRFVSGKNATSLKLMRISRSLCMCMMHYIQTDTRASTTIYSLAHLTDYFRWPQHRHRLAHEHGQIQIWARRGQVQLISYARRSLIADSLTADMLALSPLFF